AVPSSSPSTLSRNSSQPLRPSTVEYTRRLTPAAFGSMMNRLMPCWSRTSPAVRAETRILPAVDRKSTRLNSSHVKISYAVLCLKKKKHNKAGDGGTGGATSRLPASATSRGQGAYRFVAAAGAGGDELRLPHLRRQPRPVGRGDD